MSGDLKAILQLEIEQSKQTKDAISKVSKELKETEKSLSKANTALKKMNYGSKAYVKQQEKINQLSKQKASLDAKNYRLQKLQTQQLEQQSKLQAKINNSSKASRYGKGGYFDKIGRGFDIGASIGVGMMAFGKIVDQISKAINEILTLNTQIAQLQSLTNATGPEMQNLANTVYDTANAFGIQASEVMKAAIEMSKMGASVKQSAELLEGASGIAKATGENIADVASAGLKTMNMFNMEASRTTSVMDTFAYAISNSAGNMQTFKTALEYVGSAASSLGVGFEEVIKQVMILSDAGLSNSRIGTGLRKIYQELAKEGKDVSTLLDGIQEKSLTYAQAIEKYGARAAGAFMKLQDAMKGVDKEQDRMLLQKQGAALFMGNVASTDVSSKLQKAQNMFTTVGGLLEQGTGSDLMIKTIMGMPSYGKKDKRMEAFQSFMLQSKTKEARKFQDAILEGDAKKAKAILEEEYISAFDKYKKNTAFNKDAFGPSKEYKKPGPTVLSESSRAVLSKNVETLSSNYGRDYNDKKVLAKARKRMVAMYNAYKKDVRSGNLSESEINKRYGEYLSSMKDDIAMILVDGGFSGDADVQAEKLVSNMNFRPERSFKAWQKIKKEKLARIAEIKSTNYTQAGTEEITRLKKELDEGETYWNEEKKKKGRRKRVTVPFVNTSNLAVLDKTGIGDLKTAAAELRRAEKDFRNATKRKPNESQSEYVARYNEERAKFLDKIAPLQDKLSDGSIEAVIDAFEAESLMDLEDFDSMSQAEYAYNMSQLDAKKGLLTKDQYNQKHETLKNRRNADLAAIGKRQTQIEETSTGIRNTFSGKGDINVEGKKQKNLWGEVFGGKGDTAQEIGEGVGSGLEMAGDALQNILDLRMSQLQEQAEREIELERWRYEKVSQMNQSNYDNELLSAEEYANAQYQAKKRQVDKENEINKKVFEEKKKADKMNATSEYVNFLAQMVLRVMAYDGHNPILAAAIIGANTAVMSANYANQVSSINKREYSPKLYRNGGLVQGASHERGGVPFTVNGATGSEMEGGEFIVSKEATRKNLGLLREINSGNINSDGFGDSGSDTIVLLRDISESLNKPVRAYVSSQDLENNRDHVEYVKQKASY